MAQVRDARLDVYYPFTTGGPDLQIPNYDIREFELQRGYNDSKGSGRIVIDGGTEASPQYVDFTSESGVREVDIGHRIEIRALTEYSAGSTTLDDSEALLQTVLVNDIGIALNPNKTIDVTVDVSDFVFDIMRHRTAVGQFRNRRVIGDDASIINRLIAQNADEIDLSQITGLSSTASQQTATINYRDGNLLEGVRRAAAQIGGALNSTGTQITNDFKSDLEPDIPLTDEAYKLPFEFTKSDEDLLNFVVGAGARGTTLTSEFTTATGTETFENLTSQTLTIPAIDVDVTSIPRVELKVSPQDTETDLQVAVQPPAANVDDRSADYGRAVVRNEDIPTGPEFISIPVQAEDINSDNVKLVLRALNVNQGIYIYGDDTDSDGTPENLFYRVFIGYPTVALARNATSINKYRSNEARIRPQVEDFDEVRAIARSKLERNQTPPRYINFSAANQALHTAETGTVLGVDNTELNISGAYVITSVDQQYQANRLETDIEAESVESL